MDRQVLPKNAKPTHYDLTLYPGLKTFKFTGTVIVTLVVKTTNSLTLHAKELTITKAHINEKQAKITHEKETCVLDFDHVIDGTVQLYMEFNGIHNDQMAGFYRSKYGDEHLVVTQFEATDCRRCFPCWDEPNLKATFSVTLVVPKDKVALSNMNIVSEETVQVGQESLKSVKFAKTPIMSTYLLAFCVGDFDYVEAIAKPKDANEIVCRVYTLKGQKQMGEFGLGVCCKTLEFFSEYFAVAYPLPKMDMIAIPDFGAGAMENWG